MKLKCMYITFQKIFLLRIWAFLSNFQKHFENWPNIRPFIKLQSYWKSHPFENDRVKEDMVQVDLMTYYKRESLHALWATFGARYRRDALCRTAAMLRIRPKILKFMLINFMEMIGWLQSQEGNSGLIL